MGKSAAITGGPAKKEEVPAKFRQEVFVSMFNLRYLKIES